ncbi:MAG: class I SAM-dependent methyltransferase [Lachnospiraceae bacterium]|nr:class I SAM-dependent methyltransferase [Lachnospiraceae bacterium]
MEEMQYYKTVYSQYWAEQTKKYGYAPYEQNLVRLIAKSSPKKIFEVGIGTGWPIGAALKRKGIKVDGCDIAERSVVLAKEELDNENGIWTGSVLEYKGENEIYDVVYCVRASWYISDFYRTVEKMISMTKQGGYIVFDVMDKNSLYCRKLRWSDYKEILKLKYYKFLKIDIDKVDERYGCYYVSIMRMKQFLIKNKLSYQFWGERELTHNEDRWNTPKVVFRCRKGR